MFLYQPEIPPNTGDLIRLCANTGADLHLVKPLGFPLDSSKMKRAGLDYHEFAAVQVHENFSDCLAALAGRRIFALTTKGSARPDKAAFVPGDVFFIAAPKPKACRLRFSMVCHRRKSLRLPMQPGSRSMNLCQHCGRDAFRSLAAADFSGGI